MGARGHVESGGEPLVEPLSDTVTLTKLSVGTMDNNAYLLRTADGGTLLVDAAADPDRLLSVVGARLDTVVTTHRHGDHWQGLAAVRAATGSALVAGSPDVDAVSAGAGVSAVHGVWDGDRVPLGQESLEVIGLVGHTPGSVALVYTSPGGGTSHLFTGDSLFPGGPGRTTSAEDFTSLMDDLERKVFDRFDDDTRVHPGHGDDTTLGAERSQLPAWRARGW